MPAGILLIVTVACLAGQVAYGELKPELKRCPDKVFDDPGYSLGCTYPCKSGNPGDDTEYWGIYAEAPVCVDLENGDPSKFNHIGTCENGKCVQYKGGNLEQVWHTLPALRGQFHDCPDQSSTYPVGNCLFICKKSYQGGKDGYFYGIYLDYNQCKFKGGPGQCRSGLCIDQEIAGKYPIEN
uniref:Putative basic tail protein n=1 Tax=Ixodes ricinus TaxID=34613 RepID=A0A0K8R8F5_IXORI